MTRPDRETVLRLLGMAGREVTLEEVDLLEDVDGLPLAVNVTSSRATLVVSPEALGWTAEELGIGDTQ